MTKTESKLQAEDNLRRAREQAAAEWAAMADEAPAEPPLSAAAGSSRGFRWLIYFLVIMAVIYLLLVILDQPDAGEQEPSTVLAGESADVVFPATVVERQLIYSGCGHQEQEYLRDDQALVGKTYAELAAEGWQVTRMASGRLRIAQELDGLCPADLQKRCIKPTAGGIGVYTGGLAVSGELLYELPLDVTLLPEEWRSVLESEAPDAGFEFASEEELFQMLENLDEYVAEDDEYIVGG